MQIEIIHDELGKPMRNKEGQFLTKNKLQVGDTFRPLKDRILKEPKELTIEGQKKTITKNTLYARVKCIETGLTRDVYLKLTDGQTKALEIIEQKEKIKLSEHEFIAISYKNDYGTHTGITLKDKIIDFKTPK